ncbi:bifunctional ADP-dependent NAD(P)H-hydrate dehydratase/NAD(P)H-hydrate epimerase [Tabrizicola sp. TH137]|uniref:NAD(P)H-hydrate dehydratase n=1 Tax=Tabrizicola sp. TH137 TaxID=2067452 RepID=UPI000C7D7ED3|nr:NAD(P)H-hydrate dehydratase [Tabrizicola sp. TH137]PLL13697.1 bifunctional ADP-dependent NAD(P)H-hydrate dehydratase/NAD(P)H-hydrate epimerase [Tabrizicola sp. TH137]
MTELLTAAQMRAIEAAAIESGAVTGLELMERAGRGVVEAVFAEWPELAAGSFRAVVLCGPGNNGGDGFVVARLLKEWGWEVEVFLYGDPEQMPPDARVNYERWRGMGEVGEFTLRNAASSLFGAVGADQGRHPKPVFFDALFGTGLTRALEPNVRRIAGLLANTARFGHAYVVAVDIVSGLSADSGLPLRTGDEDPDDRLGARLTVTFHCAKQGHYLAEGPECCGKLVVADIGLRSEVGVPLVEAPDVDLLRKTPSSHKFGHGAAIVLSGPSGRGGAARLAARGALRVGAGLVTVGCPSEALVENAARLDAVMLRVVEDGAALGAVLEDGRIGAVCLGPGLGTAAREAGLVAAVLVRRDEPLQRRGEPLQRRGEPRPTVLDADALTILSREAGLVGALHRACVLTPHGGEFARLFPDIAEKLAAPATRGPAYSKVDATREAAARAGCVVLFKGADTVIASPDGRCAVNSAHYERAAPWLATAGSGDVLAGFIAGLMARGFSAFDAACTGAWLHVECAREFGPGLIAEDLPEMLPAVFRRLGV